MNNEKGKLIVSTKSSATGRKTYILAVCAALIVFGIIILVAFPSMAESIFGRSSGGRLLFTLLVCVLFIVLPLYLLVASFMGSKSFCDIFEKGVSGVTALNPADKNSSMQSFELSYDDILNVTQTGKTLIIYTKYAKYEVMALNNREQAAKEIRTRMSANKTAD